MAIDPPSDIVLEVARAADPTRAAAVAQRLTALAAGAADAAPDFAATLDGTGASASTKPQVAGAADMRVRLMDAGSAAAAKANKAQVQFEAVLLNNFVSEMLPKDAPETYGQGLAGQMWRSLLSEKVANQIAASGALGIGQRLFASHPLSASASLTGGSRTVGAGHPEAAQTSANDLSMASAAQINDGAIMFAKAKSI